MALLLFRQIASLFLIVAAGYVLTRLGILKSADSRTVSLICIYLAAPAVVLKSFQIELTEQIRDGFLLCLGAALLVHLLMLALGPLLARLGFDGVERASVGYSNSGNLIIPLVTALMGEEYIIYTSAFFSVQLLFVWTHGQAQVSGLAKPDWKKILTNCNLIAVVLGAALMILRIRLPEVLLTALGTAGGLLGPLSMLMVGILLAGTDLKAVFRTKKLYLIAALRLLVMPLVILALYRLLGSLFRVENLWTLLYISFLAASAPTASMITQLAQLHDRSPAYAGAINVMTTLLCILTMPLMTALYELVTA
ncbi:MAG: AEC family transporter [Oscillospiraceae bacterium]|nr:AEC family transporter [Oscillospiraceae bacterium]